MSSWSRPLYWDRPKRDERGNWYSERGYISCEIIPQIDSGSSWNNCTFREDKACIYLFIKARAFGVLVSVKAEIEKEAYE